jgi:cysteinyl-tRNA synthetase
MLVYSTLSREKEEFKPIKGRIVKMFVCGPTVYDYPHIGHAKTYVAMDVVARYLRFRGYSVFYVQNITDIDDKIINRAKEMNIKAEELADRFLRIYYEDMEKLNAKSVNLFARATQHVEEIIEQTEMLIEKGFAYESNGNVYFDISKFSDFGKLSGQKKEELIAGARVEVDENKKSPEDFALWKSTKEGEPFWNSPWGKGRPGWHIEDTAISLNYLGESYDIHGGGIDLIFPHHEAEVAIAESLTGKKPFVRYWLHTGFLLVNGEKMAKSLGNFLTIRGILEKYEPMTLRFFLLYAHYRSPIDFSYELLNEADEAYKRLRLSFKRVFETEGATKAVTEGKEDKDLKESLNSCRDKFFNAMDDDFNTREAIAALFPLAKAINMSELSDIKTLNELREFIKDVSEILGLFEHGHKHEHEEEKEKGIKPEVIDAVLEIRRRLREEKRYDLADMIREKLKDCGIEIEDIGEKTRIS